VALLDGKTILVTGIANRWSIASGIARQLRAHGAQLILTYQGERVQDAVRDHAQEHGEAAVFECDVTSDASLRTLAANAGKIDGLVHSIAYVKKEDLSGTVYDTSRDGFAMAMDISAYSLIALVGHLRENFNDGGSIMALTYLGATQIVPNYNIAGIAKAALEATVRYLAFDLGPRGIRVNAISAGPIRTLAARGVGGISKMVEAHREIAPLRHATEQAEVGDAVLFLLSSLGRGVTGEVIYVDGGYHILGVLAPVG
jgi:enoyl-[acyl-carrier protein] reductase I